MNSISKVADDNCSGCFACYNICPSNAIEMIFSAEGFYVPKIDENKCTDCGLCSKVCPVLNTQFEDRFLRPKTYVAWSLDEKTRLNSSSGGIYPEIAKLILEQNGVVFAVGWNNEWLPEHREVTSLEEIAQTIGSKYVQSKVGLSYRKVAENSKTNKKILFVGTPCQVAGLRNFLRMKKIENKVLLVDLVCFGIPSPLIFKKYIKETFRNSKISSISFRCKKTGWAKFSIFIQTEDRV
ncbi:MAG: Coenzyme F420 hydrogenase/dehydrogenase, beta subunit C-terminal domain, partial [Leptospiraceae bacterium]|nr:Coenzyme F420 hydrogenase/dehydrogenase, beta subunit C-terminal domain [Leptospiraceae bacterium]